ncbi:MAG TPA: rhomboid family intramembrane serine protease [Solirubrobacteraceae bacterium]
MPTSHRLGDRRPSSRGVMTPARRRESMQGLGLLMGIVAFMWLVEVINTLDSNRLDNDGIWPRNVDRLYGILTAPFLHVSFAHLIDNTIPFVFMGVIIALRGAARLALVTLIVIIIGGVGTWLVAPGGTVTVGASGVVFGYATYLFTRGLFDRSLLEILTGIVVGVIWGGALISSVVPHNGISWQAHVCGAVGGVVAAWLLAGRRAARRPGAGQGSGPGSGGGRGGDPRRAQPAHLHDALDRALAP